MTVDFTAQDLHTCVAYGHLWYVARVQPNGKMGMHRMRRDGPSYLKVEKMLQWKDPWCEFARPVKVGDLIYRTNHGTTILFNLPAGGFVRK